MKSPDRGPKSFLSGVDATAYGKSRRVTPIDPPADEQRPPERRADENLGDYEARALEVVRKRAAPGRAERRAAVLQHKQVFMLRERMAKVSPPITLQDVSKHDLFPYSYDRLIKQFRGDNALSWGLLAAVLNVLDDLEKAGTPGR